MKLREIKHVLVQMISLSKLGRLKLGEAQQAYQDVDGDLSKVCSRGTSLLDCCRCSSEAGQQDERIVARSRRCSEAKAQAEGVASWVLPLLSALICTRGAYTVQAMLGASPLSWATLPPTLEKLAAANFRHEQLAGRHCRSLQHK